MPQEKLVKSFRSALKHISENLDIPVDVHLWDGSVVKLGHSSKAASTPVRIASSGVISSMLKRPTLENVIRHYAVGNIAVDGDLIMLGQEVRNSVKKKDLKRLNKLLVLRSLWPFLFAPGQKAGIAHKFAGGDKHINENNKDYISFHYDVSNEFYKLFLDAEMQYSCAYFETPEDSLEQAQKNKLDMICRKLRLNKGEKFLDIGCGWGGLICYAARNYGVKAHGITLSEEQYQFTKEKIRNLGLEDQVTVEIIDYRELTGTYDKIASIGMFEHVGLANFPLYFSKVKSLLRDRGIFLNHGIARRGKANFKDALSKITPEKRLILKYIFPGSELVPIGHSLNSMEACGFEIHDVEAWREHYALTCKHWCQRLSANKDKAILFVGKERYNLWLAYLAGVAFGFSAGSILIFQTVATKRAKEKGVSGLPLTRADLYGVQPSSR